MNIAKIKPYIYPVTIAFCLVYAALILIRISQYSADPPIALSWFFRLWWAMSFLQAIMLLFSSLFLIALGIFIIKFGLKTTDFIFTQPDKYKLRSLSVIVIFGIISIYAVSYGLVGIVRVFWCISTLI